MNSTLSSSTYKKRKEEVKKKKEGGDEKIVSDDRRKKRKRIVSKTKLDVKTTGNCSHISSIDLLKCINVSKHPSTWKCQTCGQSDDIWLCLSCARVGCGRHSSAHAIDHFQSSGHPLVLSFANKAFHCYKCDEWVLSDNKRSEMALLRTILNSVQKDTFEPSRNRSGKVWGRTQHVFKIRKRTKLPFSVSKDDSMDLEFTATVIFRNSLLKRTFRAWTRSLGSKRNVEPDTKPNGRSMRPKRAIGRAKVETKKKKKKNGSTAKNLTRVPGRVGLRNLGNSCYLNAVVQAMSNTKPLRDTILTLNRHEKAFVDRMIFENDASACDDNDEKEKDDGGDDPLRPPPALRRLTTDGYRAHSESPKNKTIERERVSLLAEFYSLLRVLWTRKCGRKAVLTPHALFFAVWHFVPRFRSYDQQDAHEFFIDAIDSIDSELTSSRQEERQVTRGGRRRRGQTPSLTSTSELHRLLCFQHTSVVTCQCCSRESARNGTSICLSVSIPYDCGDGRRRRRRRCSRSRSDAVSLEDCLLSLTRPEVLADGAHVYDCERCSEKTRASKWWTVRTLPKVLVVHINRAEWLSNGGKRKVQRHVRFPLRNLDLEPYMLAGDVGHDRKASTEDARYDLSSVVVHRGRGIDTGHYTTYSYDEARDTWLFFDDMRVRVCSEAKVAESQAYLLYYVRRT